MNFCQICHNMLFLKYDEDKNLNYFCRTCNSEYSSTEKPVNDLIYERIYNNDDIVYRNLRNPYITYDDTLPRTNNIKCINECCISNNKHTEIDNNEILKFIEEKDIKNDKLIKINEKIYFIGNLNIEDKEETELIKTLKKKIKSSSLTTANKLKSEVIFIKYDNINLKFVYICCHCRTSWKNK